MQPDKGARFRKCDFQVHTLRDANWSGPFADLVNHRGAFAEALVADCRRKGIQAVAITDHHDLCLWKKVDDAAQAEKQQDGSPYPAHQRLVVFPGVELTLATPSCQAILIFDPGLSEDMLNHIWGALRVTPTPATSPKTTQTLALHTDLNLVEITKALNSIRINPEETNPAKFKFLEGRFILLPNVKKGGHKSILRDGFHPHFVSMPCVGGYIEGCLYTELDDGNRAKVEGKISQWGNRSLGVFQTSDCRTAVTKTVNGQSVIEFSDLGAWPTWVKWAEPSAEALRQACLARRSRISHSEPAFPLLQVVGVTVSDSQFLGPVNLGLNPQFNALIGGRGTGKSSLLEYVRWALCDDPPIADSTELPNFQKRRKALIDGTLKPANAKVTVFYKRNEVIYRIERTITDKADTIVVFDPNGASQTITPEQVRREFPIVSYAQKQLSCVGTLPEEINRLITDPVKEGLAQIQDRIDKTILPQVKEQRTREFRLLTLNTQLGEIAVTIKSKKEQVQALQSQLQSLTPEQQTIIQAHDLLSQQDQWLTRAMELPEKTSELLEQTRNQANALGAITLPEQIPDLAKVQKVSGDANAFLKKVLGQLDALIAEASSGSWLAAANKPALDDLRAAFTKHQADYDKCVTESAKNKKQLDEIQSLNKQVSDLETKHAALESERNTLKVVFDEVGNTHWNSFLAALQERADLLRTQCQLISEQAQHEFKAELAFCGDEHSVRVALETLIQGRNVKDSDQKVRALASTVCSAAHPVEKWLEVMAELDALSKSKGSGAMPPAPILKAAGFTDANFESIRNGVSQDGLEHIRFMNIGDQIKFAFRLGKKADGTDNYIPFDSASPGQQATCLLRTLLAQSGAPLLIDQPEEDLDNEQIHVLSGRIAETKHNRQLLFVSHNANIVVNGDAELVVCFGYRDAGDNTRGKIDPVGSIDCAPVREMITTIMEGGRQAFELRKNKYGF